MSLNDLKTIETSEGIRPKTDKINVLIASYYSFGSPAWFLERAFMSMHDVNVAIMDNRRMHVKPISGIRYALTGYTHAVDAQQLDRAPKLFDILDIFIQVDRFGMPKLKNLDKLKAVKILWAIDTHYESKHALVSISGMDYFLRIAQDFDYIFAAHKDAVERFKEAHPKVFWLPLAADPYVHKRYDEEQIYDVAFIGSMNPKVYKERVELIARLSKEFNVIARHGVYLDDVAKIFSKSKLVFNKSFKQELNLRVFEALSCGRCLLTDKINDGMEDFFEDRKHLVLYENSNLEELVRYFLENEEEREKIARNGQQEVHAHHTFFHRASSIIDTVDRKL